MDLALIKGSKKSYLKYEEAFDSLKQTDEWTTILDKEYNLPSNFDLEYYGALTRILAVDQAVRKRNYIKPNLIEGAQRIVDSINLQKLVKLIDEKGFPNFEEHGFEFTELSALLIHQAMYSDTMFLQVVDIIELGREYGIFAKSFVGFLADPRLDWMKNSNLTYGLWFLTNKSIDKVETVDARLYSLNALSLEYIYKIIESELPQRV